MLDFGVVALLDSTFEPNKYDVKMFALLGIVLYILIYLFAEIVTGTKYIIDILLIVSSVIIITKPILHI